MSNVTTIPDLDPILSVLVEATAPLSVGEISRRLAVGVARRTLQYRLAKRVGSGQLLRQGAGRWTTYSIPEHARASADDGSAEAAGAAGPPLSTAGREIAATLDRALSRREPVGYVRGFLDDYRPNETHYLTAEDRKRLREMGSPAIGEQPAGTYARQILDRLLIDLSWNSSRLEGNTYSLLDTRRLLAFSQQAKGKDAAEAQMILNHKGAIEFLVDAATEAGFDRLSIFNLHALLAHNLLPDPASPGRLRRIVVGIHGSVFYPLEVPQLIEECFDRLLAKANAILDPFEQAFFVMVQLPYLQPFDDANKRVSRLAANIPLIRHNLCPLSFTDVPTDIYRDAVLGVYELRRVALLRDVFLWAYVRSAARYAAIRQSMGAPDPFRLRFRDGIREVVASIVCGPLGRRAALRQIDTWATANIEEGHRERFREVVETEVLALHEGNFARYRIRPSEFMRWQALWNAPDRSLQPPSAS